MIYSHKQGKTKRAFRGHATTRCLSLYNFFGFESERYSGTEKLVDRKLQQKQTKAAGHDSLSKLSQKIGEMFDRPRSSVNTDWREVKHLTDSFWEPENRQQRTHVRLPGQRRLTKTR